jgi:general stress protein 26
MDHPASVSSGGRTLQRFAARTGMQHGTPVRNFAVFLSLLKRGADMNTQADLEEKLWKHLKSDMTVMLGLTGVEEGHARPMTAQFMDEQPNGPMWFFTGKDHDMVRAMGARHRALIQFESKGHDLFASVHGELVPDNDRTTIDKLWNKFIAAWFPGGKSDPNLQLIRFEPERAQVWLNENNLMAGIKLLMGKNPQSDYQDKVANIRLG